MIGAKRILPSSSVTNNKQCDCFVIKHQCARESGLNESVGEATDSEGGDGRQARVRSGDTAGQIDVSTERRDEKALAPTVSVKSLDTLADLRDCCLPSYMRRSASSIAGPSSFIDLNPQTPAETVIVTGADVHF